MHWGGGGRGIINKLQSWAVNILGGGSREWKIRSIGALEFGLPFEAKESH